MDSQSGHYTNKIDLWGLGCILYEMSCREKAFGGDISVFQYASSTHGVDSTVAAWPEPFQSHLTANVNELLNRIPEVRPRASDACLLYRSYTQFLCNMIARGWCEIPSIPDFGEWKALVKHIHKSSEHECMDNVAEQQHVAEIFERMRDHDSAITQWFRLVHRHPDDWRIRKRLAEAYVFHASIIVWEDIVYQNPKMYDLHERLDEAYERTCDIDLAINGWKQLVNGHPDDVRLQARLSAAYLKKRDLKATFSGWKELVHKFPHERSLQERLRKACTSRRKIAETIECWASLVEQHPDSVGPRDELAKALDQRKSIEQSLCIWTSLVTKYPDDEWFLNKLESEYRKRGGFESAITGWSALIQLYPDNRKIGQRLWKAFENKGDTGTMISGWTNLVDQNPGNKYLVSRLAKAYRKRGSQEMTLAGWKLLVTRHPDSCELQDRLYEHSGKTGALDAAVDFWQTLVDKHPHNEDVQRKLMRTLELRKDSTAATYCWSELLTKHPRVASLEKLLSAELVQAPMTQVVNTWFRLVELHPDVDAFQVRLGDAYRQKGADGLVSCARAWCKLTEKYPNNVGISRRWTKANDELQSETTCFPFSSGLPIRITRVGVDFRSSPTALMLCIIRRADNNDAGRGSMQIHLTEVYPKILEIH